MKNILLICSLSMAFIQPAHSQPVNSGEHCLVLNHLQIKDGLNYGLVFRGPGIHYSWSFQHENRDHILRYDFEGGFNYMESRKIGSGNIHVLPVRLSYLFKNTWGNNLTLGPYFIVDYNYALYPDLQSGYSFTFSHISSGIEAEYPVRLKEHALLFRFRTTAAGITSRPPLNRDPYFFDLSFGDAFRDLNRDFHFGGWKKYNVSSLEIRWMPVTGKRVVYGYKIQYSGYYPQPSITLLEQAVEIIWLPKIKSL